MIADWWPGGLRSENLRFYRKLLINHPVICMVLMVLFVVLVFLGVVLVVLEVTGPQVALTQVDPAAGQTIIGQYRAI